jgi:hypothetical protein
MWRPFCSLFVGSMVGVACLSAVASAGVTFVSQDRRVEAAAFNGDEPGTKVKSATGFGPFHATIHATFLDPDALGGAEGSGADATQDSTIGPSLLHTFSSLDAAEQDASAFSNSIYAVTFDVSTTTPYHLHEQLTAVGSSAALVDGVARLHHSSPSGPLVFDLPLEGGFGGDTTTDSASGQLAPGRYYFEADAGDRGSASVGQGTFSADLTLGNAVAVPLPPAALTAPCAVALVLGPFGMRRAWSARRDRRRRRPAE